MRTNHPTTPSSDFHAQTTLGSVRRKCAVAIAFVLFSGVGITDSKIAVAKVVPQSNSNPSSSVDSFAVPSLPPLPSLQDYQHCLSKAMDIIDSGDCNGESNVVFCIKAQFLADSDSCALYL